MNTQLRAPKEREINIVVCTAQRRLPLAHLRGLIQIWQDKTLNLSHQLVRLFSQRERQDRVR